MAKSNCNLKSNNMQEIVFRSNDNQALTTSEKTLFVDNQQLTKKFSLTEVELIAFQEGGRES